MTDHSLVYTPLIGESHTLSGGILYPFEESLTKTMDLQDGPLVGRHLVDGFGRLTPAIFFRCLAQARDISGNSPSIQIMFWKVILSVFAYFKLLYKSKI